MTDEKIAAKDFWGIKTKREALGMTLKDVYSVTRISVVNLEAIENGDFQSLPVPTYTKNFIKIYAQALDMDSKPILDGYEAYLNSLQDPTQKKQEKEPIREEEVAPEKELSPKGNRGPRYKAYVAVVAILVIAAVVGIVIFQQQQPQPTVTGSQRSIAPSVPQVPAGTPAALPAIQPAATAVNMPVQSVQTTQPNAGQPVVAEERKQVPAKPGLPQQKDAALVKSAPGQVVPPIEKKEPVSPGEGEDVLLIRATEETWLRIKIDQNPPFQVLLKPGEVLKRKGTAFGIDIGNAGGIKVTFKGKDIENLGKSGKVVHLQLP